MIMVSATIAKKFSPKRLFDLFCVIVLKEVPHKFEKTILQSQRVLTIHFDLRIC